jgi:hypothetical protein
MAPELAVVLLGGMSLVQAAILAYIAALVHRVYRQGDRVSPGEAIVFLDARKHRDEIVAAIRELARDGAPS